MKKIVLLGTVAILALSSCKKIYTCECSAAGASASVEYEDKMTKKDAEEKCDEGDTSSVECEIK